MNRQHLISDTQIATLQTELRHLRSNTISCPDTDESYRVVLNILSIVRGE